VTFKNELTGKQTTRTTDQIVVEHGTTPAEDLFLELQNLAINKGVTNITAWANGDPQPSGQPQIRETPGHPEFDQGENKDNAALKSIYLYRIGDAISSRNIHTAILDAHRLMAKL